MTRAKRVHQGERTQHEVTHVHPGHDQPMEGLEVPLGRTATLTVHDDGTSEAHLEPLCKNCAKRAVDNAPYAEVTSPKGTIHLAEHPYASATLCGGDATDWWTR